MENTASLRDLLLENGLSVEITFEPFCFFMHQGYMATWFDLISTSEDPECFFFSEAHETGLIKRPIKFTAFLKRDLDL